ncbi:MAG: hypothetical protein HY842_19935 [Bacteroidetes bacterium]|nr:hypothetical protein [Bacteroidota bacterium]
MKKPNKRKIPAIIYVALASLVMVILAAVTVGEPLLNISAFVLVTFATGLGYLLSRRNDGEKSARFAKALLILAILVNVLAAGFIFQVR